MGLADSIEGAAKRDGRKPVMPQLLDDLSPEDRKVLEAAFANPRLTHAQIGRALRKEGHSISDSTVRNWRERG